jgi:hypothetical protein
MVPWDELIFVEYEKEFEVLLKGVLARKFTREMAPYTVFHATWLTKELKADSTASII